MMRHFIIGASVALTIAAMWAVQTSAMAPAKEADPFEGKLVLIYFKGRTADHAFTLEKVKFTELNGSKMLAGVHADTEVDADWMGGKKALVVWDAVESMTFFDSVDEYKKEIAPYGDDAL